MYMCIYLYIYIYLCIYKTLEPFRNKWLQILFFFCLFVVKTLYILTKKVGKIQRHILVYLRQSKDYFTDMLNHRLGTSVPTNPIPSVVKSEM